MLYTESLRNNLQFQSVLKNGKSFVNRLLICYVCENSLSVNRLGISVSKKVGNSVVRHRVKRLIKESYRLHEEMFNSGLDIVIIARPLAKDASYEEVKSALLHIFNLHKIKKDI